MKLEEASPIGRSENKASVELRFVTIRSLNDLFKMPTSQGVVKVKADGKGDIVRFGG